MVGTGITYVSQHSSRQQEFLAGYLPTKPPEGFYKGTAHLLMDANVPWLGKAFVPAQVNGFNVFTSTGYNILKFLTPLYKKFSKNAEGTYSAYVFKTYTTKALRDEKQVFVLDYNSKENPFLIRIIVDEIVETKPNEFLGKIHVKIFPGFFITLGYFSLKK